MAIGHVPRESSPRRPADEAATQRFYLLSIPWDALLQGHGSGVCELMQPRFFPEAHASGSCQKCRCAVTEKTPLYRFFFFVVAVVCLAEEWRRRALLELSRLSRAPWSP